MTTLTCPPHFGIPQDRGDVFATAIFLLPFFLVSLAIDIYASFRCSRWKLSHILSLTLSLLGDKNDGSYAALKLSGKILKIQILLRFEISPQRSSSTNIH